jgi:hypothetical protein
MTEPLLAEVVNFGQAGANANTGSSAAFPDNGHIDVPFNSALNPASFTVTLWANASSTGGFASPITSRDDVNAGVSTHGFILYNDNGGNWSFWTGDGNPGWDTMVGGAVATNTLGHTLLLLLTQEQTPNQFGSTALSLPARLPLLNTRPTEQSNSRISTSVPGADDGNSFFFGGNIDDVAIWDEALDQATIQLIKDNGVAAVAAIPEPTSLGLHRAGRPRPVGTTTRLKQNSNRSFQSPAGREPRGFFVLTLSRYLPFQIANQHRYWLIQNLTMN